MNSKSETRMSELELLKTEIEAMKALRRRSTRRKFLLAGLILAAIIGAYALSATHPAGIAQGGYGPTLQQLLNRIIGVETVNTQQDAKLASLQSQIDHIQLTPGPKGDKGDTGPQGPQGIQGPAGPVAYNRYPSLITNDFRNPFVIPDSPDYNLYATDPAYTFIGQVYIVLPHANSVPAGTILEIRQELSPQFSPSGYITNISPQSGDALKLDGLSFGNIQSLRVYSDWVNTWWPDAIVALPPPSPSDGSGGD